MALRLYSEFTSHNGKEYKIEIHDNSWALPSSSFVVASDGFTLNYSGETDDIVSPIIGSNATISAYNNTDAFDSFINDLKEYQDNRFTVKITVQDLTALTDFEERVINDGGIFEAKACLEDKLLDLNAPLEAKVFWTGVIMQDLVTIEDTHKPYIFKLTAVDGIGLLANKDYTWATYDTIESFLERTFTAIGNADLYSTSDRAYATTLNTWDTNHVYSESTDVATLIRYHAPVLYDREQNGTTIYPKYLEVLTEICIAFGARYYQREGAFIFEQYLERDQVQRRVFNYNKSGTLLENTLTEDDIELDGTTSGGARLANNQFNFLPAVKRVEVKHNKTIRQNLLGRFINFYTTTTPISLGVISDDNNAYLKLDGTLIYKLTHPTTGSNTGYFRPGYRIQLKLEDQANPGTYYYLKRDWSPSGGQLYGATTWTTTASYYYLDASLAKNSATGLLVSNLFSVVTPPLPVTGEAEIDIEQNGLYNQNNNSVSVPSGYFAGWSVEDVLVSYRSDESNSVITKYISSNNSVNIKSNLVLDLGEVRLADAFGGPGSFLVYDGGAWVASSNWRRGNSGSYTALLELLTKEVLSLHIKPIERYTGTIVGAYAFGQRFNFESGYWLPLGGSYNANLDEWAGEWYKIEKDETDIATDTPVDDGNAGDFSGRVSSSQGTDEFINAVDVTTTTSEVTGNATVGGTLGVTGDISASSDIIASGDISAVDVSATNVTASNDVTATGNLSATNVSASNNITANNQLTAANASLDNFVTKTAIIGSTALVDSFKTRVENDGGTFEAFDAVLDAITPLLIGTAEKSAVIYGDTSVETLDASKSITASGNVSATNLNASNNATITGTLSVSGASLLQSTGVTNFTHTGNQIENIRDIQHEPGDVYSINDSDFMIFNTWSPGAANGTSTINLPAAADHQGRLLRFKSDGTISSNHEIRLVPDGGDTIDGSGEFSFSRDYDGVMIMAHNGEWFIVQRKSK